MRVRRRLVEIYTRHDYEVSCAYLYDKRTPFGISMCLVYCKPLYYCQYVWGARGL